MKWIILLVLFCWIYLQMNYEHARLLRAGRLFSSSKEARDAKKKKKRIAVFEHVEKNLKLPKFKNCSYLYVWRQICQFAELSYPEQKSVVVNDSGIGLMLFMAKACHQFPVISLELDCRGDIEWYNDSCCVRIGEIKSVS